MAQTQNRPHLAVIDPATHTPEVDCFNAMARRSPLPLTYHLPALHGLDSLHREGPDLAGIVILGSGASVHDDAPWISALGRWLAPYWARDLPILGLCFGHQLLAHLFGGEIGLLWDGEKRRGTRVVRVDAPSLLATATGPLVISHREGVLRPPADWRVVATSDDVVYDGIAHPDRPIWGFQPHPEATAGFVANNKITVEDPKTAFTFGHRIVDGFLELAAEKCGCR